MGEGVNKKNHRADDKFHDESDSAGERRVHIKFSSSCLANDVRVTINNQKLFDFI